MNSADVNTRRTDAIRAALSDPETRDRHRRAVAQANRSPEKREKSRAAAMRLRPWERALAAVTPESRQRAAKTLSNRRLAHIPPSKREERRRLLNRGFTAEEATRIVLDEHAREVSSRLKSEAP